MKRIREAVLIAISAVIFGVCLTAAPAQASVTPGNAALNWEESHAAGCWYAWGGTSCGHGYDCSGVIYEAFLHSSGINVGRDTYAMLRSPHLRWIPLASAQRGDLLFYGTGHVEIKTVWWHTSFGAHHSGTRVGYAHWNSYWAPTMAFRVVR
jgi:cell wall-associated NlpC family hydrolase